MIVRDYLCPDHGRFEEIEERDAPPVHACPQCGADAERVFVASAIKIPIFSVPKGGAEKPPPGAIDYRPIYEGQPVTQWRAEFEAREKKKRKDKVWKALKSG